MVLETVFSCVCFFASIAFELAAFRYNYVVSVFHVLVEFTALVEGRNTEAALEALHQKSIACVIDIMSFESAFGCVSFAAMIANKLSRGSVW